MPSLGFRFTKKQERNHGIHGGHGKEDRIRKSKESFVCEVITRGRAIPCFLPSMFSVYSVVPPS